MEQIEENFLTAIYRALANRLVFFDLYEKYKQMQKIIVSKQSSEEKIKLLEPYLSRAIECAKTEKQLKEILETGNNIAKLYNIKPEKSGEEEIFDFEM